MTRGGASGFLSLFFHVWKNIKEALHVYLRVVGVGGSTCFGDEVVQKRRTRKDSVGCICVCTTEEKVLSLDLNRLGFSVEPIGNLWVASSVAR